MIENKRPKYLRYLLFISAIGFLGLTAMVVIYPPTEIDKWFSLEIQEHSCPLFDRFMFAVSTVGYMHITIPVVLCTALIFLFCGYRREALFTALTLCSGLISSVVKYFVNRPRPTSDLVRVIEITRQQSFPSGHVMFYTVFFGMLIYLMYRLKQLPQAIRLSISILSASMIILISISRIYLGAHWLTDVLAGYLLGFLFLNLLIWLYRQNEQRTLLNIK